MICTNNSKRRLYWQSVWCIHVVLACASAVCSVHRESEMGPPCRCSWQRNSNDCGVALFCSSGVMPITASCKVLKICISALPTLLFLLPIWHMGVHSVRSLSNEMWDNRLPLCCGGWMLSDSQSAQHHKHHQRCHHHKINLLSRATNTFLTWMNICLR